jgi:hypothetical protein
MSDRTVRYRLSEQDFVAAAMANHHAAMSNRTRWLIIVLVMTAVLLIQLWREHSLGDGLLLMICLLIIAGLASMTLWLVDRWLLPWRMRRYYRQTKRRDEEVEVSWDEQAIHFRSSRGESHTPLSDWHAWARTGDSLLLYENGAVYYAVPANAVGEDGLDDLTALLAAAGAKEKRA